jgi:hypothetical protein
VTRIATLLLTAILVQAAAAAYGAPAASLHWVQIGPGGAAELRAITAGADCPSATIDGVSYRLVQRAAPDANFQRICAMTLPAGARVATLDGAPVPLPKQAPQRILVIGDTGCRIEGNTAQACNDPDKWPFARIAAEAAKLNPDLTIHVGDYDYRESPCPAGNSGCAGSVWGDNGPGWEADFFTPAAPLLAAAPFVFVRGNHEECARFGTGWLRLLGPLAFAPDAPCVEHIAPYAIPLPGLTLAVMDDATAPDAGAPRNFVQLYRGDLAALKTISPGPVWLTSHRPLSGYVLVPPFIPAGGNQTLLAAMREDGFPQNIELMISGHIHAFEAINYLGSVPPQLVAGNSGDTLSDVPMNLAGINVGGLPVASGMSLPGFGYLLLTHSGAVWNIDVYDVHGAKERNCVFDARKLAC